MLLRDKHGAYSGDRHAPELQPSVVAFVDLLGFSDMIREANDAGRSALLSRVSRFLDTWREALEDRFARHQRAWEIRFFSDNIFISHPIRIHELQGDFEMGSLFSQLSLLQLGAVADGFFMRGSIAVGSMFVNENVIFGFPLVEAYECERSAKWPRVSLAASARNFVLNRLGPRLSISKSPYFADLVEDSEDGQLFLNYLEACFQTSGEPPEFSWIEKHHESIRVAIDRFTTDSRIGPKYTCLAQYHNFWCMDKNLSSYRIQGYDELSVNRLDALQGPHGVPTNQFTRP